MSRSSEGLGWRSLVELGAALATLGGLALFVLVRAYLNEYYGSLGVDPDDVGLGYSSTLGSSIGLILFLGLAAVVVPAIAISCVFVLIRVLRAAVLALRSGQPLALRPLLSGLGRPAVRMLRRALPPCSVAGIVLVALLFSGKASDYADAVMAGRPIRFGQLALTSFKVRATPMQLSSVSKPGESPEVENLSRRARQSPPLLYLGQANGTLVAYDSVAQQAVYVPAAIVVVRMSNCEVAHTVDPDCRGAID